MGLYDSSGGKRYYKKKIIILLFVTVTFFLLAALAFAIIENFEPEKSSISHSAAPEVDDYNRIESLSKYGENGWANPQEEWMNDHFFLIFTNQNYPNKFRSIKYINCLPDPALREKAVIKETCEYKPNYYKRIVSDDIVDMGEIYQKMVDHENASEYKDRTDQTQALNNEGWQKIRQYYDGECPSGRPVTYSDYFKESNKTSIRRVASCDFTTITSDRIIANFDAEKEYFESGMYKGD